MFDIGWSEMFVIVVVALVVIGPKDLPRLIREVGRWTSKARGMAREFQRSFDDMVREAELEDIRKTVEQARPSNLSKTIRDAIDPEGELDEAFVLEEEKRKERAAGAGAQSASTKAVEPEDVSAEAAPSETTASVGIEPSTPPPVERLPRSGEHMPQGASAIEGERDENKP